MKCTCNVKNIHLLKAEQIWTVHVGPTTNITYSSSLSKNCLWSIMSKKICTIKLICQNQFIFSWHKQTSYQLQHLWNPMKIEFKSTVIWAAFTTYQLENLWVFEFLKNFDNNRKIVILNNTKSLFKWRKLFKVEKIWGGIFTAEKTYW